MPAHVFDYRELARQKLPRQLFDFIDGGAFEERTIKANHADYSKILLRKRLLRDVSTVDTAFYRREMAVAMAHLGLEIFQKSIEV